MKIQTASPQSTRNQLRGSLWLTPHGTNLGSSQSRACSRPTWLEPPAIIPEPVPLTNVCRAMFRAGGTTTWEYAALKADGNPGGSTLHSEWGGTDPGPSDATQDFAVSFDSTSRLFSCRLGSPGNTPSTYTIPTGTLDDPDRLSDLVLTAKRSNVEGTAEILAGAELAIDGGSPETLAGVSRTEAGSTTLKLARYLARGFTVTGQIKLTWTTTKPIQSYFWIQVGPDD